MYSQLTVAKLFDLSQTQAETLLNRFQYPWEALPHIKEFILALGPSLPKDEYEEIKENVWAAKSAVIFPTAYLNGPVIIGKNTEVRHAWWKPSGVCRIPFLFLPYCTPLSPYTC